MGASGDEVPLKSFSHKAIQQLVVILAATAILFLSVARLGVPSQFSGYIGSRPKPQAHKPICTQIPAIFPRGNAAAEIDDLLAQVSFLNRSIEWLGGAVRIPTETYDTMGPIGIDSRWDIFKDLHQYVVNAFPRVHKMLRRTTVNTYALVYHWQGSDSALKPLLLTAHQDVVPVDPVTRDNWVHPPYSGHYDGTYIWGRGSLDDKSGMVGVLSAVEILLESGFIPRRTVVIAFGFDEESSSIEGAGHLAHYLEQTYGRDGFALLVDEGGGVVELGGAVIATPDIAEKGYFDVNIQVTTPGGHSSVPPSHTSIGLLSTIIVELEMHPSASHLTRVSPFYTYLQCLAENAPLLSTSLAEIIRRSFVSDEALRELERILFEDESSRGRFVKSLLSTTQAVDLISGGVKVNALPESAAAVVNHRISTDSSVEGLMQHMTSLILPLAQQHNLSLNAFGSQLTSDSNRTSGAIVISDAYDSAVEPSPISPIDSEPYKLLSGTIKATYEARCNDTAGATNKPLKMIVAPGLAAGNTDTRWYWNLTQNIFRYNYATIDGAYGEIHTVNEAIKATMFVDGIRFFTYLILNADGLDNL